LRAVNAGAPRSAKAGRSDPLKGYPMSRTAIPPFDHAPEVMAQWLDELCTDLGWSDQGRAYVLLRETLHAIRDLLTVPEAADLASQLPILARGLFFDGWAPDAVPIRARSTFDLMERVAARFAQPPLPDPERAVMAVLDLLRRHVEAQNATQPCQTTRRPTPVMWH
jgi:uncharacterized protein (DUF2267 family)